MCCNLIVTIQRTPITADYYIFLVAACPLSLRMQWLATLRPINTNYSTLTMTFALAKSKHTFQGLKNSKEVGVLIDKDFHNICCTRYFIHLISEDSQIHPTSLPPDLDALISSFANVFGQPSSFPPRHNHDHRIPL